MSILPITREMPVSFRDPLYAQLARLAEQKLGLPSGILDAIRTRGERSNANQVSSAGARSPYQFIPDTRRRFIEKYQLDPWADAGQATEAAARHVLDDFKRTGSWDEAIARYHGGQRPGRRSRRYAETVGSFDGAQEMPYGQSLYPAPYYGADPLAPLPNGPNTPEPPKDTVPLAADPGMSTPVPAGAPAVGRKRGGILGALESVFMPDPDSRWAAALRGGLFDAKANQQKYKDEQAAQALNLETANAKLKALLTKGEYQIAGNNVVHIKPDGGVEIIAPPQTQGEKERLIDRWQSMSDGDPAKALIERMLLGANSDPALQSRERQASTRAGATVQSARIRGNSGANRSLPPIPEGWSVVK